MNDEQQQEKKEEVKADLVEPAQKVPIKNPRKKLTFKQKRFAKAYVEASGNATEAVRRSYPGTVSPGAQKTVAHKLITQCPHVVAEIERIMASKGLTVDTLSNQLEKLVTNADCPTAQNQAIRTSLELLRLIGGSSHNVAVQVNITSNSTLERARALLSAKFKTDETLIERDEKADT